MWLQSACPTLAEGWVLQIEAVEQKKSSRNCRFNRYTMMTVDKYNVCSCMEGQRIWLTSATWLASEASTIPLRQECLAVAPAPRTLLDNVIFFGQVSIKAF